MPTARSDDPAIEGLRGFAAVVVVVAHYARFVTDQPGAWGFASTGVDLFFVLSGYVFAPHLFGKPLAAGPHFVRRIFRLYPLYVVALLTYAALKQPDPTAWSQVGSHLLMLHTLQSHEAAFFYNPAFWSLPPEVEFYLLLPLLALAYPKFRFGWMMLGAAVLHLALTAAGVPGEGATPRAIATIHLPGLLIEFLLGAWAWKVARDHGSLRAVLSRLVGGLGWLAIVCVVFAFFVAHGRDATAPVWLTGNIGLASACGYALVVSGLAGRARPANGPLIAICLLAGQLSYGVYLFHNAAPQILAKLGGPLTGWLALGASVLITLLLAWAAHHVIEAPARDFGRRLSNMLGQPTKPAIADQATRSK
jgi:peptidoglycan/LPS O-acetylase OafA/YrhL